MIKRLLSLPPNLIECFHEIEEVNREDWFCTSDPVGQKLGSGGGTVWLLESCRQSMAPETPFTQWLGQEKRILLHAGGQSRRLPGYAPSGKILTPIPVFRWARGQQLDQNLLSLQLPLYEKILERAPEKLHTLIASGDVYIRTDRQLQSIPEADVVCYGLWADPILAKNHGVFAASRQSPEQLDFMLQKPSVETLNTLMQTHLFLMDIGIWLLSDKAVELLANRACKDGKFSYYDLYSDFGQALGRHPTLPDQELQQLSVAILPLEEGEFYHYGTSRELISSTLALQNKVVDQRAIMQRKAKAHPALFTQNTINRFSFDSTNSEIWIENSFIGKKWELSQRNIITGIPENNWEIHLTPGICIDVVPIGDKNYVVRPYGIDDPFRGAINSDTTSFLGQPVRKWLADRQLSPEWLQPSDDLQSARLFPVCGETEKMETVLCWMIGTPISDQGKQIWLECEKLSANEISDRANLKRLYRQREHFRKYNWEQLAENHEQSIFYQLNLKQATAEFKKYGLAYPAELPLSAPLMTRIHDAMFRDCPEKAFSLLRQGLVQSLRSEKLFPHRNVFEDQIVWGRSPVRIDLAGGWTDTPSYCLTEGGSVVNMAIELNGQPPLQVYVKSCPLPAILLRSIDLGASEKIETYEELQTFNKVGSPFSIPKAALLLAGFSRTNSEHTYPSLQEQLLQDFGGGLEITLLSAIPAGSGLGTSSILAATVLAALAEFCGLQWDQNTVCHRTLILEQMLTTGGGWQDQYGGVLQGIKLLQTENGFNQSPQVRWLPDFLFTQPEYQKCHLLYYTGITRTAKHILAEIVRNMFLNDTHTLNLLREMKVHTGNVHDAIQRGDFRQLGKLIRVSWEQNKLLDAGTAPDSIEAIIRQVSDYTLGYKLPGAGGGGFLYMIAKDPEAAARIRQRLLRNPPNNKARFVEMTLSAQGLQLSKS